MSSWLGINSGKSSGKDGGKISVQPNKKKQFPVVVELDEKVLLNDFVIPKKNHHTTSSDKSKGGGTTAPLLIGSIDQGTSSTRFLVFCSTTGKICCSAQMEHAQIVYINENDKVGWHEHDPVEIYSNTLTCVQAVQDKLRSCLYADVIFSTSSESSSSSSTSGGGDTVAAGTGGKNAPTLAAVGLTNQRETTIAWNKVSAFFAVTIS
jgi:FGGY family of carbohydrate kinases, N-terminal domain